MQRPFIERLKSRKFLAAVANFIFIVLNELFGVVVDREAYLYISGVIITWIAGESYVDGKAAEIKFKM